MTDSKSKHIPLIGPLNPQFRVFFKQLFRNILALPLYLSTYMSKENPKF